LLLRINWAIDSSIELAWLLLMTKLLLLDADGSEWLLLRYDRF
jgi:hypothetical protein